MSEGMNLENLDQIISLCHSSSFLSGKSNDWKVTFDWVMYNDKNWIKVLEGQYVNNSNGGQKSEQFNRQLDSNNNVIGGWLQDAIDGYSEEVPDRELPSGCRTILGTTG